VQVGKKGALLMLVVAVLWAAAPGFACLMPVEHHSCCKSGMQECASMMGADMTCCQVRGSDTSYPAAKLYTARQSMQGVQAPAAVAMMLPPTQSLASGRAADAPPPAGPPGSFVLRI
jgi:hypothetical protein